MIMFIFDLIHFYEGLSFRIKGTSFRVIVESEEQVEISFTRLWDPSLQGKQVPLNIDKRYSIKSYICIYLWFRFIVMMNWWQVYIYIMFQVYNATWFPWLLHLCHLRALKGMASLQSPTDQDCIQTQKRQVHSIAF